MRIVANDPLTRTKLGKGQIAASYLQIDANDNVLGAIKLVEAYASEHAKDKEFWNRVEAADAYITSAIGWDRLHSSREAERCWMAALELLEPLSQPAYERRLARVRATLAQRWAPARRGDARRLANAASKWYRAAGGYENEVTKLDAIATAR
jgi:hypothetical protein